MKVQITYNQLTVTLYLFGGLTVTERVFNVTAVITRFYIKKKRCSVSMPLCILFTMSVKRKTEGEGGCLQMNTLNLLYQIRLL